MPQLDLKSKAVRDALWSANFGLERETLRVTAQGRMARPRRPSFVGESALRAQLHRILDIAEDGLAKRGFGEEALLAPLRTRAERLSNPALETLSRLDAGEPIDSIAADFGRLWP